MRTASSSSRAGHRGLARGGRPAWRRAAIPYRVVTNFSSLHRDTLASRLAGAHGRPFDPDRMITASSAAAAYTATPLSGPADRRAAAPDAPARVRGPGDRCPSPRRSAGVGRRGRDRRRRGRPLLPEPGRRCSGSSAAGPPSSPCTATRGGSRPRVRPWTRGRSSRPRVRHGVHATILGKPSPEVFRQALAGLRPTLAGRCRPAPSRWSATIRTPTSGRPSGSACAASSC